MLVGLAKRAQQQWLTSLLEGLGERLVLAGQQSVIQPWYEGLSILVQPSYFEGYGLVHLEAMASGCCVVASRLKHVEAWIEHGRTGFFFDPGDVKGLRDVLGMLMRDPQRVKQVGQQRGRARAGPVWHRARGARAARALSFTPESMKGQGGCYRAGRMVTQLKELWLVELPSQGS